MEEALDRRLFIVTTMLSFRLFAAVLAVLYMLSVAKAQLSIDRDDVRSFRQHLIQDQADSQRLNDISERVRGLEASNLPIRVDRLEQARIEAREQGDRNRQLLMSLWIPIGLLALESVGRLLNRLLEIRKKF